MDLEYYSQYNSGKVLYISMFSIHINAVSLRKRQVTNNSVSMCSMRLNVPSIAVALYRIVCGGLQFLMVVTKSINLHTYVDFTISIIDCHFIFHFFRFHLAM